MAKRIFGNWSKSEVEKKNVDWFIPTGMPLISCKTEWDLGTK